MKKVLSLLSISGLVILTGCFGGNAATKTLTNPATTQGIVTTSALEPTTTNAIQGVSTTTEPVIQTSSTEPATQTSTTEVTSTTTEPIITSTTVVTTTTTQGEVIDYANELFISEFYNINFKEHVYTVAGTNNNKAIELYNPSNETIDLSNYTVKWFSNGSTEEKGHMDLEGSLAPKTCYTLVNKFATDFLKINGDVEGEIYIGPKSAVGLYKNGQLIDVFGTIGASYDSNDEFVINGEEAATDVHNVKRNDGARGSVTFVDTDWIVSRDGDGSTFGIHEDDETNNSQSQASTGPTQEQLEYFHTFISENYYNEDFKDTKLNIITEKDGYTFEYDFTQWSSDPIIGDDGTIDMDYVNSQGYGFVYIFVKMKDANGNVIYETNDNDNDSYGYIYIYPTE